MKISGPAWREATLVDCVAAAGAGDQRAFAELFERYRQYAWGVARSVTRSHQAAEEATVDGFAAAFRSIDRLRDPARFPSYLAACVRNEALQEVRRRTPTADSGEFEDVELDSLAEPDTPETRLVSSEEGRRALEAFRRLDDRQREAILLVDVEGVEPSEVAATFGITVNALHQLLHRSREALRHRYVAPAISEASPSACLTCNDKLGVYLAGRASVRVISMVDDHTSTCPDCQARLADARETNDCVRAAYGVAPVGLAALLAGRHGFLPSHPSGRRLLRSPRHRQPGSGRRGSAHGGSGRSGGNGPRGGGPPAAGGLPVSTPKGGVSAGGAAEETVSTGVGAQPAGFVQSLRQIVELPQRLIGVIPHALSWAQLSAFPMGTALAVASGSMTTLIAMAATVPLQIGGPAASSVAAAGGPSVLAAPLQTPRSGPTPLVDGQGPLGATGTTSTTVPADASSTTTVVDGNGTGGGSGTGSGGGSGSGSGSGSSAPVGPAGGTPSIGSSSATPTGSGSGGGTTGSPTGGTSTGTGAGGTSGSPTTTVPSGVAPAFTAGGPTTFFIGAGNTFEVHASGNPIPSLSESGALPAGVTFSDQHDGTGVFAGDPGHNTQGVFNVVVSASNGVGPVVTLGVQLTVTPSGPVEITSSPVAFCQLGRPCSISLTASGTPAPTLSVSGTLPPGLSFAGNGPGTATISGVAGGSTRFGYLVTITASNGVQASVSRQLWIVVWSHD